MVAVTVTSTPNGGIDTAYGPTGFKGLIREPVVLSLSLFASLGGVLFGYDQGVISGILVMDDFVRIPNHQLQSGARMVAAWTRCADMQCCKSSNYSLTSARTLASKAG